MARRGVVGFLQQQYRLSQRAACRLAGISRQAMAYRSKPSGDQVLRERLKALGEQYPRYGYLMLHAMLKSQGLVINRKRTYRKLLILSRYKITPDNSLHELGACYVQILGYLFLVVQRQKRLKIRHR